MENGFAAVGRWRWSEPTLEADEKGSTVIFSKSSISPLEVYEWGIDAEKRPFERYRWCENDFYEECDTCKAISEEELMGLLADTASFLREHGCGTAAVKFDEIGKRLKSRL